MSNAKLKQATTYIANRTKQKRESKKKQKESQARKDAEKFPGQLFVLNKNLQAAIIYKLSGVRLTLKERDDLFKVLDTFLKAKEAKVKFESPEAKAQAFQDKKDFKRKTGDFVYIVSSFEAAKALKFKSRNPDDISQIQARFVNNIERRKRDVSAAEISKATQLGHGDRGASVSQFNIDRAVSEAAQKYDLSDSEVEQLNTIVTAQRRKHNLNLNVTHDQIFTRGGIFKKGFRFVISGQRTELNAADTKIEKAVFMDTLKELDVLNTETSTLPADAVGEIILGNIAGKQRKGKRVKGKRRKTIKESSKANATLKTEKTEYTSYRATRGIPAKGIKKQKAKKGPASSPLQLLGILNQKLPETVRKNMDPPALQNQTGRFASSVKATDISTTKKGFPSVGYTYDRDNYGQYEASSGSRFASAERDPRTLIDRSMREIASSMAIGRFFTRRV